MGSPTSSSTSFDTIRRLFDRDHRSAWEDALSALEVFAGKRIRVVATTPEKVMASPSHPELPEATAQVMFSDETDTPRVTIDFYEFRDSAFVGLTYYVGEIAVAGGFSKIPDIEAWIGGGFTNTAKYLNSQIKKVSEQLGDLGTR